MTSETDAEFVERIKREWDGDNVPCVEDFDQLIALARRGAAAAAEIERLRAALRGVLEEAAKVAEDNEPEPSKEEMDDSYDAVAAYRVGRWEAAGDIATAIRALKEEK